MPRSRRIRNFIQEYAESPTIQKMSFIPSFFILLLEFILIKHAVELGETFLIVVTSILLIISLVETILVSIEIHRHYVNSNFDRILTIKLDDFITEEKQENVKKIVEEFINKHPEYGNHRNKVYHTTCQVLQTHKEEKIEQDLIEKLEKFIDKNKKKNVDEILRVFIKKNPKYKKFKDEIYRKICFMKSKNKQ